MLTRLLSIAIVSVFSIAAQAQLHSDRYSPINYLGRYSGFGYSDGYHACKDGQCNNGSMLKPTMAKLSMAKPSTWNPWEPMSSFYGSATAPSDNRIIGNSIAPMRTTTVAPLYTKPYFSTPSDRQPMSDRQPLDVPPTQAPVTKPLLKPSTLEAPPSLPLRTPAAPIKQESVPPAPIPKQSSPSDHDKLELPEPTKTSQYFTPSGMQNLRVPPGSRSVVMPSALQLR